MTHNPASLFADLASPAVACLSAKHAPPALWVPRSRLAMAELVFNVAFSVEVVLRFIADGGIRNYFREAWNVFDFLMVMAGYSSLWIGWAVVDTVVSIGLSSQALYAFLDTIVATLI